MIFVTVGTQLPFDRLVTTVDEWAGRVGRVDVFAQIGPSRLTPRHIRYREFLEPTDFATHFAAADLVISHAGMGTIISAMSEGKPIIVMPRLAALKEHRNDHQVATAARFRDIGRLSVAMNEAELLAYLDRLKEQSAPMRTGLHASQELLETLRAFVSKE